MTILDPGLFVTLNGIPMAHNLSGSQLTRTELRGSGTNLRLGSLAWRD